jgi:hypothetical protein
LFPGWGMSWWWREQGLDPLAAHSLTMEQRLELMDRYWRDVGEGWEPAVPRERWVGPYHPFERAD